MSNRWKDILKEAVERHGQSEAARILGVSPSAVSQLLAGKYRASLDRMALRIELIFGAVDGKVACPVLAAITPELCMSTRRQADKVGVGVGDPARVRLHARCKRCAVRG